MRTVEAPRSNKSTAGHEDDGRLGGSQDRHLSTIAVHGGEARHKPGDSITDPIFCASTYTFPDTQSVIDFIEHEQPREEYGRYGNPGERVVERKLAALEGGQSAVLFSSGMAAIVGLLMAKLSGGDEVIFFDECYHRSREFCVKHLSRFGVTTRQVKTGDYEALAAAITPDTKLLVSESPTNPHLSCIDLERFVETGHRRGVETLIDATLATRHAERCYAPVDAADSGDARPCAAGLVYPVITLRDPWTHELSRRLLLGDSPAPAAIDRRSAELQVDAGTPPLFLVHALDDTAVPVENSIRMLDAMRAAKRPVEAHLLQEGGHAFGVGRPATPSAQWIDLMCAWLERLS